MAEHPDNKALVPARPAAYDPSAEPASSPGQLVVQAPKGLASGMSLMLGTGVGALLAGAMSPGGLPTTPAQAVAWADALREAGAPGAILVLLGVIYYLVSVVIPRREAAWEAREERWGRSLENLQDKAMEYKDTIKDQLIAIITDGTAASVELESTLKQVLAALQTKRGRSDGAT